MLKLTAAGMAAAAIDLGDPAAVRAAAAGNATAMATNPVLTTVDATVKLGDPGDGGYRQLVAGPGEPISYATT
jgi:hypothetical protein